MRWVLVAGIEGVRTARTLDADNSSSALAITAVPSYVAEVTS